MLHERTGFHIPLCLVAQREGMVIYMEDTLHHETPHKAVHAIKHLCLSKGRIPFYGILSGFASVSLFLLVLMVFSGDSFFEETDIYAIFVVFVLLGVLILLSIMTPLCLRKRTTEATDEAETLPSMHVKILSLWIPMCLHVTALMVLFGICGMLSPGFNMSLVTQLTTGIGLCGLLFIWTLSCAGLYYFANSGFWYYVGFLVLNFAPIMISLGCYSIYNVNPLVPHEEWNPLFFNLFVLSGTLLLKPIVLFLVSGITFGIFACMGRRGRSSGRTSLVTFSVAYKMIVIFLVSLSAGFLLSSPLMGRNEISFIHLFFAYLFCFFIVTLPVAIFLVYCTFRKDKLRFRMGITILAVVVSSALILGVIPAICQNKAYMLPDKEEIERVELFLDSMEQFEVDEHLDDSLSLHQSLLDLFEEGYMPKRTHQPDEEAECIADLWENVTIRYKLKDGKTFYRDYVGLKDPVFDEWYIGLLQSDMYAYSLQKTKIDEPVMRCEYGDRPARCELSESCVKELLATYCSELKKADKSAFYEKCATIRLAGVYEKGDRFLYIPLSFTETQNLVTEYLDKDAER